LQHSARRHSSAQELARRCRIVLACAEGRSGAEVAAELRVHPATVSKWRRRFAKDRLDGLVDAPRPGAARTIGDDVIEAILVETLETAPPDATHWSTRGLAAKHGISHQTVAEIWRAFGLKPWREDSFKVSPDPELVEGPGPGRLVHEPAGRRRRVRPGREAPGFLVGFQDAANGDFRVIAALALAAAPIVLTLLLRSPVAPLYLLPSMVLSFTVALGLTVIVFQGLLHQPDCRSGSPPSSSPSSSPSAATTTPSSPACRISEELHTFVVRTVLVPAAPILLGRFAFWPSGTPTDTRHAHPRRAAALAHAILAAGLLAVAATRTTANPIHRIRGNAARPSPTTAGRPPDAGPPAHPNAATPPEKAAP